MRHWIHKIDESGSLERELERTAEMLVEIATDQGIYFAVAFLFDSSYDNARVKRLLPVLKDTPGGLKPNWREANIRQY